jgi:agmatine deiminase
MTFSAEQKPAALGFRWPAEWERHSATWLSWPRPEGISFPDAYERVMPVFVEMVRALASSEAVHINVWGEEQETYVRRLFKGDLPSRVKFFPFPAYEPWCRDHGPIFLTREEGPRLCVLDWGYNAWGGKYPPFDLDDAIPTRIAERFQLPVLNPGIVLEGGSIDGNGEGTILTTESCLLNPNRNPSLSRAQIETYLKDYLGARQILWLGEGIEGDDTDGHVDDITRFISRSTVLTTIEPNTNDPNHEPLQKNYENLKQMRLWDGTPLTVIPLPMPRRLDREDLRLPASYANFYIANEVVLLPVFQDKKADQKAVEILEKAFPSRKILPIDCTELIWGLGAFHCLTQQEPAI